MISSIEVNLNTNKFVNGTMILNEIINRLTQIQSKQIHQQMKYIATIIIGEKAGLHTSVSCFWDGTTDGCVTVKWENQNLFLIVTVFGLAI